MPGCDNIVRYYERFVDKRECMLYIVMEYCEGGDLAGVIQRCRRDKCARLPSSADEADPRHRVLLPEAKVWSYLTQITLALAQCHAEVDGNGHRKTVVLHRDIKPENGAFAVCIRVANLALTLAQSFSGGTRRSSSATSVSAKLWPPLRSPVPTSECVALSWATRTA